MFLSPRQVNTIGDAYVVVTGCPVRIGDSHVTDMANLGLDMIKCVKGFTIPHMTTRPLKIKIGLHSGPVIAGQVTKFDLFNIVQCLEFFFFFGMRF